MALDRVQCGSCGHLMDPCFDVHRNMQCTRWYCTSCGRDSAPVGREWQITAAAWFTENPKTRGTPP